MNRFTVFPRPREKCPFRSAISGTAIILLCVSQSLLAQGTDLARGKTATASSQESTILTPAMAVDGNATTRWSSAFSDPQWIRVDLGSSQSISSVKLVWEAASAKNYTIGVSTDGSAWTTVATKTNMASGARTDNISGLSATCRYVRMNGTARTTVYGYSLFSFEVYGGTTPKPGTISLVAATYSVNENGLNMSPGVTRTNGSDGVVSVDYATSNGTAIAGSDYTARSGTLTLAAGVTDVNIPAVFITDDAIVEGNETFTITLSNPTGGATIGSPASSVVTIIDDEQPSTIVLPGRIQAEEYKSGGEGVGYHDLTTGNTGGAYRSDNVDIQATTDAGGGYNVGWFSAGEWLAYDVNVQQSGTYKFTARVASANAGTKTLSLSMDGATLGSISFTSAAGWQSFTDAVLDNIVLSAGSHVLRVTTTTGGLNFNYLDVAASTILKPGTLALVAATYSVNENGLNISPGVTRTNGSDGVVTVNYTTSNGTAAAGSDYTARNGTLTFAAGETNANIPAIFITDDAIPEGDETFTIALSNPTGGATIGTPSAATITINDNDQPGLVDLALNKTATASSQESTLLTPNMAFDGNTTTRWSSAFSDPQWVAVDLGAVKSISSVKLVWEAASAKNYTVAVSNDNATWTTIVTKTNMAAGARTDSIGGLSASGRYVRMNGTSRTTAYGYSLFTFSVYGINDQPGLAVKTDYYAMVLNYDPVLGAAYGNQKVSQYYNWWNVDTLINQFTNDLRRATGGQVVWHVAYRNNLNEFPPDLDGGVQHTPDNYPVHFSTGVGVGTGLSDYATIAYDSRFGIAQKVDAGQIDAVWVFAPPFTGFYETAMAGNNAYWINGIANNITTSKKFVFYGFNYERDIGCMLENLAHMSEQLMMIKGTFWPAKWSYNVWNSFNLRNPGRALETKYCNDWQRFVLTDQVNYDASPIGSYCASPGNAQAGSGHFSPNSTSNYGFFGFSDYFTWGPERWTPYTGTWNMDNGAYHVLAGNGVKSYCRDVRNVGWDTADFAMADFVCETDLRVANQSSSSSAGVMFRTAGFNTNANSGTGYYAGINAYSDQVVLARINNGYGLIASPGCVINANESYHLKIVASGSSIKVFVNNMSTPLINAYDAGYASGGMALASYGTDAWFGNVIVNINAKSYADAWHAYPDLSGASKNVNFDDWASSQEGWFCWWFEHIPKNPGTHDDVDIVNGQKYNGILNTFWPYILDLNNFDGATGYTNVTFPAKDVQAPAAPTGLTASAASSSAMWLSWSEPSDNVGVTRYEVYRNSVLIQQVWHPYYTDNGLAPGTAYTYTIKARDGSANVSAGTTVTGTTMP